MLKEKTKAQKAKVCCKNFFNSFPKAWFYAFIIAVWSIFIAALIKRMDFTMTDFLISGFGGGFNSNNPRYYQHYQPLPIAFVMGAQIQSLSKGR